MLQNSQENICARVLTSVCREKAQNLDKRFNWHNSCFRNPTAYSFFKILNTHFSKGYCKDSLYTVNIIEKLEGTGRTDRNTMDFAAKPIRKARETYWMHELRTIFPYGLNDGIGDEFN